jgi:hypothetical protein
MPWRAMVIIAMAACQKPHAPAELPACMYLRGPNGHGYSLGYAGQTCATGTHPALPQAQYGAAADWAYNAPRDLSTVDAFRVYARLATLDTRGRMVFDLHSGLSSAYKWGDYLKSAQAQVANELGYSALLDSLIERPLTRAGFASGHGGLFRAAWHWQGLDARQRRALAHTLAGIELQLERVPQLTISRDSSAYIDVQASASRRTERVRSAAYLIEF